MDEEEEDKEQQLLQKKMILLISFDIDVENECVSSSLLLLTKYNAKEALSIINLKDGCYAFMSQKKQISPIQCGDIHEKNHAEEVTLLEYIYHNNKTASTKSKQVLLPTF
jgi:hypothetical protein